VIVTRIRILPEILSNKIAAGEVVERPASVVKELVENALDAEASRIFVDIEGGGRSLIRVSDNGTGMGRDDAMLALERYATSKIYREKDLFSIKTLGFRGEAIPSIASVSRFTLETRQAADDAGTQVVVDGGTIRNVTEIGAPAGTQISVRQLFFNTPARRKFLKTVSTEMGHIGDTVANFALGSPAVQFRLTHNGKIVRDWPGAVSAKDRVVDVLAIAAGNLCEVNAAEAEVSVSGWLASPHETRSTARGIYLFVNGRAVTDRTLRHALFEGYRGHLMKGRFPVAVILVQLAFDQVDVNVHPTKHEVRFADARKVHGIVEAAVAQALARADRPRTAATFLQVPSERQSNTAQPSKIYRPGDYRGGGRSEAAPFLAETLAVAEPLAPDIAPATYTQRPSAGKPATGPFSPSQRALWRPSPVEDLRIIGQCHDTYLLCESKEGLILVDQHAAHERIVYETLKRGHAGRKISAQRLLLPETLELSFSQADILQQMIPDLDALGFEIEPFGQTTFAVKSVPGVLAGAGIPELIREIVERAQSVGLASGLDKVLDPCLMIMACHGAIRANQRLTSAEAKAMLAQLYACDNPSHCPHGRPVWIRWTVSELEKAFKRTGAS
jgi:DNA mismatch repair protein MutL